MIKYIIIQTLLTTGLLFAQSVEECLDCHADEDLTKSINDSTEISLFVDLGQYQESIHGDLDCIDCHSTIEDVDHAEELPDVSCAECHDDSQEEYSQSIHFMAANNGTQAIFTGCKDCHGTHDVMASDDSSSYTYILNIENTCGHCHSRADVISILGLRGGGPVKSYHNSVHNKILREQPDKGAPTCISCHGYHEIFLMSDARSSFNKVNRAETCGHCHESETEEYYKSVHWHGVERGHFESPTCNDCHGEHNIHSPQDEDAITNRLNLSSKVCANCHASEAMMARFGLDPDRIKSYNRTYHGLAVLKGSPEAANCTSCHEVHSIRSASNPESSVHLDNLRQTCGNCHENISPEFIGISVHPKDLESRNPVGYLAQNIYIWIIIITIGGMIIHNIIIVTYFIRKKRQEINKSRTYNRFQPFEVYQHALLIISFFTLVITGFALKFPDALFVQGLAAIGLDEELRSLLHRIAAVVMIVISLIQFGYFLFNKNGRRDLFGMLPKFSDITGFWKNIRFHLFKSNERPKFGRWDYTEKAEYLALIWGTAVMILTGFILWFPEFFMSYLPVWSFEVAEIIHYFEAWLATLAIIIWHWFFVIYHPEKYPMSVTWMDGKISEEELKHHHPLEYEELEKEETAKLTEQTGMYRKDS
jgi:cytochrome b subunit of formate dehydrogenase